MIMFCFFSTEHAIESESKKIEPESEKIELESEKIEPESENLKLCIETRKPWIMTRDCPFLKRDIKKCIKKILQNFWEKDYSQKEMETNKDWPTNPEQVELLKMIIWNAAETKSRKICNFFLEIKNPTLTKALHDIYSYKNNRKFVASFMASYTELWLSLSEENQAKLQLAGIQFCYLNEREQEQKKQLLVYEFLEIHEVNKIKDNIYYKVNQSSSINFVADLSKDQDLRIFLFEVEKEKISNIQILTTIKYQELIELKKDFHESISKKTKKITKGLQKKVILELQEKKERLIYSDHEIRKTLIEIALKKEKYIEERIIKKILNDLNSPLERVVAMDIKKEIKKDKEPQTKVVLTELGLNKHIKETFPYLQKMYVGEDNYKSACNTILQKLKKQISQDVLSIVKKSSRKFHFSINLKTDLYQDIFNKKVKRLKKCIEEIYPGLDITEQETKTSMEEWVKQTIIQLYVNAIKEDIFEKIKNRIYIIDEIDQTGYFDALKLKKKIETEYKFDKDFGVTKKIVESVKDDVIKYQKEKSKKTTKKIIEDFARSIAEKKFDEAQRRLSDVETGKMNILLHEMLAEELTILKTVLLEELEYIKNKQNKKNQYFPFLNEMIFVYLEDKYDGRSFPTNVRLGRITNEIIKTVSKIVSHEIKKDGIFPEIENSLENRQKKIALKAQEKKRQQEAEAHLNQQLAAEAHSNSRAEEEQPAPQLPSYSANETQNQTNKNSMKRPSLVIIIGRVALIIVSFLAIYFFLVYKRKT